MGHLDLKPGNVLLDSDGSVRLADFSIAAITHAQSTLPGAARGAGTEFYRAPEQDVRSTARLSLRADMWSFAVLALELLTGTHPSLTMVVAHGGPLPAALSSVPEPLQSLLRQCLVTDSAQRPDASTLYGALERLVSEMELQLQFTQMQMQQQQPAAAAAAAAAGVQVVTSIQAPRW